MTLSQLRCWRLLTAAPLSLALALATAFAIAGCATPERPGPAVDEVVPDGERVAGFAQWTGDCRKPSQLGDQGFLAPRPQDLPPIWLALAGEDVPMPEVNWARELVLVAWFERSPVTILTLHTLVRGPDGAIDAYFIGNQKPLMRAEYNYPYCVARIPTREFPVTIHIIEASPLTDDRWRVEQPRAIATWDPATGELGPPMDDEGAQE